MLFLGTHVVNTRVCCRSVALEMLFLGTHVVNTGVCWRSVANEMYLGTHTL